MFAIYDIQGLRFRDTLEKLRQVQQPSATARLQLHSNVAEDETPVVSGSASSKADMALSSQAQQAYRDMLHLNQREPIVHAQQLMSHPVSTIPMEMDILAARRYFQQQKFQQMPVVNTSNRLVGMLSVQDLLQFILIDGERMHYLRGKKVSDAMSSGVITADPISDIRRVARLMQEYHLHGVPIVDQQDILLGIVSQSDILRAVTNEPPLNMWS
ncbi:MAG: CBS domain-containing protein [Gammaproteobacteria bacterium]|jgi:CBS-domain-containing membrane protein|nr:CBS domain-containing protein [Gammaproteobacteria bacterium]MBT7081962.1 CBS domain-containing protein [Chloroflexota bacterium]MBT3722873.1 CBS domain-containing protein [Gammaproteobacteria bacterium]MBT4077880.1 CBS domain-containing protein [Gammaproteobacteria bacterium]MBT4195410.1 CBS domain-containing protein [Gammaproteobacteria bacterium]